MVEVVEGVSEIFTIVAGLKNIKIVQDVPVADVAVRADIDMVKTVIRNLISNAIKFSNCLLYTSPSIPDPDPITPDEEEDRYLSIKIEVNPWTWYSQVEPL